MSILYYFYVYVLVYDKHHDIPCMSDCLTANQFPLSTHNAGRLQLNIAKNRLRTAAGSEPNRTERNRACALARVVAGDREIVENGKGGGGGGGGGGG